MIGRKTFRALLAATALFACPSCQIVSDPPKAATAQDVEFLRGCWVSKGGPGGPVQAFLRLLPEGADGPSYQGYFHSVHGAEMKQEMHLSFTRDGASMTLRRPRGGPVLPMDQVGGETRPYARLPDAIAAKLPKAKHRASYALYPGQPQTPWLAADGGGETLVIYLIGNGGEMMGDVFRGERDGCD